MLPKDLNIIIEQVKKTIILNKFGELILPERRKIMRAMGEYKYDNNNNSILTIGRKRRAKLAALCAEKVIDKWQKNIDNTNDSPRYILDLQYRFFNNEIDINIVKEKLDNFMTFVNSIGVLNNPDDKNEWTKKLIITNIGDSITDAVSFTWSDEKHIIDFPEDSIEEDFENECLDAAYYASVAYSESITENIEKRREFWYWYLDEAVPKAYEAFSD